MNNEDSRKRRSRKEERWISIPGIDLPQGRLQTLRRRVQRGLAFMEKSPTSGWIYQIAHAGVSMRTLEYRVMDQNDHEVSCFRPLFKQIQSLPQIEKYLTNLEYYGFKSDHATFEDPREYVVLDYFWAEEVARVQELYKVSKSLPFNCNQRQSLHVSIPGVVLPNARLLELQRCVNRGVSWLRNNFTLAEWSEEILAHTFQFDLMKLRYGIGPRILRQAFFKLELLERQCPSVPNQVWFGLEIEGHLADRQLQYMALDALWTKAVKKLAEKVR